MRPEVGKILTEDQVNKLRFGDHDNPQHILGRHMVDGGQVISFFHPDADSAKLVFLDGTEYEMENIERAQIFAAYVPHQREEIYLIHIMTKEGKTIKLPDPYSFPLRLKKEQLEQWKEGNWIDCYRYLGAHPITYFGIPGVYFAVWAPNAKRVSVVGDFNHWDGRVHPMIRRNEGGIFELFVPLVEECVRYKYEIKTMSGDILVKADPFANEFEVAPRNAPMITDLQQFIWTDKAWMERRKEKDYSKSPVAVYEVHLGSWRRTGNGQEYLDYEELAHQLAEYVEFMKYTHVELMGVLEHLRDGTKGHEIYGFFAPTSRFGTADGFRYLINYLHERNIGVILDWTPAGVTKDPAGISHFDGTPLFECEDEKRQDWMRWDNVPFDYSKKQVCNYMMSNLRFWMDEFHIDGFRIALQDSILYEEEGKASESGYAFLYRATKMIEEQRNGCMVITERLPDMEEHPIRSTFQWTVHRMGALVKHLNKSGYGEREEENKKANRFAHLNSIGTKIIKIAPHVEKRHGSMIEQMPGDYFEKFANLRTLYGFTIGMQGKKHFFMGQDFAQWDNWNIHQSLDWHLLKERSNRLLLHYVQDLMAFYRSHRVLYETDGDKKALRWLSRKGESEIETFLRIHPRTGEELLFVCNFTPIDYSAYRIGIPEKKNARQVFSSDDQEYGGLGTLTNDYLEAVEEKWNEYDYSITLKVPKQSIIILEIGEKENEER